MTAKDQKPGEASRTRAERLRDHIKKITRRDGMTGSVPEQDPTQPRSPHEIIEERMRNHVGEKKP